MIIPSATHVGQVPTPHNQSKNISYQYILYLSSARQRPIDTHSLPESLTGHSPVYLCITCILYRPLIGYCLCMFVYVCTSRIVCLDVVYICSKLCTYFSRCLRVFIAVVRYVFLTQACVFLNIVYVFFLFLIFLIYIFLFLIFFLIFFMKI